MYTKQSVPTFSATIYCGLKDGRRTQQLWDATALCQSYVNRVGLCVSVTATNFIYTDGFEPGFSVGLMHYPCFPSTPEKIREAALELAELLRSNLGQRRVLVVFPDETVMLSEGAG